MLRHLPTSLLVILATGLLFLFAAERRSASKDNSVRPRATHAELAEKQRPVREEDLKEVRLEDVDAKEAAKVNRNTLHRKNRQQGGLIARSTIVSSGSNWTLVPKEAILHIPSLYTGRINQERKGELIGWHDFYGKNRGWIRTVPVTLAQARGEEPLSEEFLESLKSAGQVVVATCKGGPISVKAPPAEPEDPAEAAKLAEAAAAKEAEEAQALRDLKRKLESAARLR